MYKKSEFYEDATAPHPKRRLTNGNALICVSLFLRETPSIKKKEKASLYGLCLQKYKWAEFRKTKAGVKLRFRLAYMDDETVVPEKVILTPAKKNDRSQLDALVDEVGLTYVYDRGYIDYARFDDYWFIQEKLGFLQQ
jgi:hypothetical protein